MVRIMLPTNLAFPFCPRAAVAEPSLNSRFLLFLLLTWEEQVSLKAGDKPVTPSSASPHDNLHHHVLIRASLVAQAHGYCVCACVGLSVCLFSLKLADSSCEARRAGIGAIPKLPA